MFNDKVVIGFGGGDFGAVRGYVTAYDTATGKQLWRCWTVPGDPAKGFENQAMEMAAQHLDRRMVEVRRRRHGLERHDLRPGIQPALPGHRQRWPVELDDCAAPAVATICSCARSWRSNADTGEYVWHYQTTPGDAWDYNSAMDMTLATLNIDGRTRKVLLHAPKNGFFYVIDRADGELLSAEKLGKVTWAERVDLATGRPVVAANAFYEKGAVQLWPSFQGVHNWFRESFSPRTGLVYLPVTRWARASARSDVDYENWTPIPHSVQFAGFRAGTAIRPRTAAQEFARRLGPGAARARPGGSATPGAHNGGTLATAGDLVFQGQADGYIHAYAAGDGRQASGRSTLPPPCSARRSPSA